MILPTAPRGARRTTAVAGDPAPAVAGLLPALLLLAGAVLLVPRSLEAQARSAAASGAGVSAEARARLEVGHVTKVWPDGPVTVRFGGSAARDGGPVVSATATRLRCAGNVPHVPAVRRVEDAGPAEGSDGGQVEWSGDGGGTWHPLTSELRPVAAVRDAGRHAPCASIRFRWVPAEAGPSSPPRSVTVRFRARAAAGTSRGAPSS